LFDAEFGVEFFYLFVLWDGSVEDGAEFGVCPLFPVAEFVSVSVFAVEVVDDLLLCTVLCFDHFSDRW